MAPGLAQRPARLEAAAAPAAAPAGRRRRHLVRGAADHDAARLPLRAVREHAALPRALRVRHRAVQPGQRVHRASCGVLDPPALPGARRRRGRGRLARSTSSPRPGRTPGARTAAASSRSASTPSTTSSTRLGFSAGRELLRQQDVVLFDAASRPEFGDVRARFDADGPITTEVNNRTVKVVGLVEIGPSFGIDGTVITSIDNWLRLFPDRPREEIQLGLIRLRDGADPVAARDELRELLPKDVLVLTKQDFIDRERAYWNGATPIGFVFAFGAIMGLVVGRDHRLPDPVRRRLGAPQRVRDAARDRLRATASCPASCCSRPRSWRCWVSCPAPRRRPTCTASRPAPRDCRCT